MAASLFAWVRRPGVLPRLAISVTLVAILSLAPIYLQHQWPAAQVAIAPWYVALVREPFFAGIMMFTYWPGYLPYLYAVWTVAVASWVYLIISLRRLHSGAAARRSSDAALTPAE
jgi:hypothetical protein